MRKKILDLKTRQPAPVRLANTSIAVVGKAADPQYLPVVNGLTTALITELVGNEKSLVEKPDPQQAVWTLGLIVTSFSVNQPQQITEGTGNSAVTYNRWNGTLHAAYQVLDKEGRVHDAANIASNYNKDFPASAVGKTGRSWSIPGLSPRRNNPGEKIPSSVEDVKESLVTDIVQQIASKLGNTTKTVEVQVATGDTHLDRASEFLLQQLWTRALDELEKTPPFEKPDQEAYRQYDLGLAYEAISYSSTSPSDQKDNIFKAAEYYDKALEMNQKEKYFVVTVARTRDALARFKDLDKMAKQDQKVALPREDASASTAKPTVTTVSTPVSGKPLTAEEVIKMYKAGLPADQIQDIIQQRPLQFDPFDTDTAIAINNAKLPVSVQNAMRAKVGAPPLKMASSQKSSASKTQ